MGLLDDAIREHLELKRRRGADSEEVTRQEHEALGPSQRGEFAAAPAEPGAEAAEPAAEPLPEEAAEPHEEPDGWLQEEPPPEPEPEIALGQPTVEYTPEPPPAGDPEAEDVLEETPEFLQETPEHDRLWFEQKPPRDFDLDR
jgi:hypothetical protein